jgi:hypothetical protein
MEIRPLVHAPSEARPISVLPTVKVPDRPAFEMAEQTIGKVSRAEEQVSTGPSSGTAIAVQIPPVYGAATEGSGQPSARLRIKILDPLPALPVESVPARAGLGTRAAVNWETVTLRIPLRAINAATQAQVFVVVEALPVLADQVQAGLRGVVLERAHFAVGAVFQAVALPACLQAEAFAAAAAVPAVAGLVEGALAVELTVAAVLCHSTMVPVS